MSRQTIFILDGEEIPVPHCRVNFFKFQFLPSCIYTKVFMTANVVITADKLTQNA
jgi:hypothetical protein